MTEPTTTPINWADRDAARSALTSENIWENINTIPDELRNDLSYVKEVLLPFLLHDNGLINFIGDVPKADPLLVLEIAASRDTADSAASVLGQSKVPPEVLGDVLKAYQEAKIAQNAGFAGKIGKSSKSSGPAGVIVRT